MCVFIGKLVLSIRKEEDGKSENKQEAGETILSVFARSSFNEQRQKRKSLVLHPRAPPPAPHTTIRAILYRILRYNF